MTSKEVRKNKGKVKLTKAMLMPQAMAALVEAIEYGEVKYSPAYEKGWMGYDQMETLDSMMRHTLAVINGEWIDEESGLPHMSKILFNAAVFAELTSGMTEQDWLDRYGFNNKAIAGDV